MGCMSRQETDGVCPACGFDPATVHHPLYLRAGTLLTKRFIAGKLLFYNGEGASYLGYDLALNRKVVVREYMPDVLAVRESDGINVLALKGKETQYKALLSDFCDLHRTLQKLRTYVGVIAVLDFLEINNTAYAIYDYYGDTTLKAYIEQNGPMPWDRFRDCIAGPLAAVEAMHTMGIYHRGISPATIYVDEQGVFRLGGFCIAAARTAKSELAAELFSGYSPPELYSLTDWQGSWTDVYSLAAVSYYALTAKAVPDAAQRKAKDTLLPAHHTSLVSPPISDVLRVAMSLEPGGRPQTIGELALAFSRAQNAQTAEDKDSYGNSQAVQDISSQQSEKRGDEMYKEQLPQKKREKVVKRKIRARSLLYMLSSMFITTAVLVTLMFVILSEIDSSMLVFGKETGTPADVVSEEPGEEEEKQTYHLPNFVGSYFETIQNNPDFMVRYALSKQEEYNEEYPVGVIFEQNPVAQTPLLELTNVAVKVSKGPAPIPDNIVGMSQSEAEDILRELKINYEIAEVYDDTHPAGYVVGYTRLPGEMMLKVSKGSMGGPWNDEDGEYFGMPWDEYQDFLYG